MEVVGRIVGALISHRWDSYWRRFLGGKDKFVRGLDLEHNLCAIAQDIALMLLCFLNSHSKSLTLLARRTPST